MFLKQECDCPELIVIIYIVFQFIKLFQRNINDVLIESISSFLVGNFFEIRLFFAIALHCEAQSGKGNP